MPYELMTCIDDVEKFLKRHAPEHIMWGPKLDGVRCAAYDSKYQSRNGLFFKNFDKFNDGLAHLAKILGIPHDFFDGEVTSTDKSFAKLSTQLQRKYNIDDSFLHFKVFDVAIKEKQIVRYKELQRAFNELPTIYGISLLPHHTYPEVFKNIDNVYKLRDAIIAQGYEGLVIKYAFGEYENKKSSYWCKVKRFHTLDLPVIGRYEGKTGKNVGKLGGLIVSYRGVPSNIGGGYDDAQRKLWWECPESELPKIIEVKYQEITKANKLRFSDFVRVREDKNEVDG